MSDESMVERGKRALLAKVPRGYGMTENEAEEYVRAVIAELREPTEAMNDAWISLMVKSGESYYGVSGSEVWRAMIDAELDARG